MRILVTGASGLLGLNLALEASAEHQVYGVVNRTPIKTNAFTVLTADLLEEGAVERLLEHTQPDWVVHCAALASLEACEKEPVLARRINTEVPEKLAIHVGRGGARLLHVSTDAVFDGQKGQYNETDETNPLGVYARTKRDAEDAVLVANPEAVIARVTLFGFNPTGKPSLAEFFLNNLLVGRQLKGFTDVYFCPLLVNDIAHIFIEMLSRSLTGMYHVFSSETLSKYDFGLRIAEEFGCDPGLITPISIHESGLTVARSPNLTMSTNKLSTALGRQLPRISPMLDRFSTLYQQGYPQMLKSLMQDQPFEE